MLQKWPIRNKLLVGLVLLLVIVLGLSWGGIHGLYAYRALVKDMGRRSGELPLANEFYQNINDLSLMVGELRSTEELGFSTGQAMPAATPLLREEFRHKLEQAHTTLAEYRQLLDSEVATRSVSADGSESQLLEEIEHSLRALDDANQSHDWMFDRPQLGRLANELEELRMLSAELPLVLYSDIQRFTEEARSQYRTFIGLIWGISISALGMFVLLVHLFYKWVFRPLRILIKGSRRIAGGEFNYQIRLDTHDEMAGLARAMNEMTYRFRTIRDDLDRQVQERTREVVRSEQLASVGFLAAGVAHEINNPLASIALCAESLEERLLESSGTAADERSVERNYLRMIQQEAFRCKDITERLLDISRIGEVRRQDADLADLVQDVIDTLSHLGRYEQRHVVFSSTGQVVASINLQEIKQVVLNLVVNGLDALEPGGTVRVELRAEADSAVLIITDDGCGMTPDVLQHLYEPFFTRRRGGQGTGLGLSIVYRIVADHDGVIEATSDGPGKGSRFVVRLPLAQSQSTALNKESRHHFQAA